MEYKLKTVEELKDMDIDMDKMEKQLVEEEKKKCEDKRKNEKPKQIIKKYENN